MRIGTGFILGLILLMGSREELAQIEPPTRAEFAIGLGIIGVSLAIGLMIHKAVKKQNDGGKVDGITKDGIPIQVKTFQIGYKVLSQFLTDAKYHPKTPKPIKKVIVVSQTGFDDGARQRKFEIETTEGIEVYLTTPADMLNLETT